MGKLLFVLAFIFTLTGSAADAANLTPSTQTLPPDYYFLGGATGCTVVEGGGSFVWTYMQGDTCSTDTHNCMDRCASAYRRCITGPVSPEWIEACRVTEENCMYACGAEGT